MMHGAYSLGRRLSWWLALQSLAVLTVLCGGVYAASRWHLEQRQGEALEQKREQVRHLLLEATRDHDLAVLRHNLDDFFIGHMNLALVLTQQDGGTFYQGGTRATRGDERRVRFEVPHPAAAGQVLAGSLALDARDDAVLLRNLAATLIAAALVGALGVSAGGFALVKLGLRPVRQLVRQTRDLSAERLHQQLDGSAQPEELQPLIAQFNDLLSRLALAYDQLEGFNADVAHELCTPLATLISSTEIALRRGRSGEELRDVLGSHLDDLNRVSAIVTDMLFLSHADRGATARREPVASLAVLVTQVAEYHEAALEEAGLRFEVAGDAAGAFDVGLLRRAVSNLIGNATRFAEPGSAVRVEISTELFRHVAITVRNRGAPITPSHLPRIFDRFYRSDRSRPDAHQHHGLGLSIVAAIARMHQGEPFAISQDGATAIGVRLASSQGSDRPEAGVQAPVAPASAGMH